MDTAIHRAEYLAMCQKIQLYIQLYRNFFLIIYHLINLNKK